MRSLAREAVFKYIYSRLFNPCDEGLFDVLCKDLNNSDKSFAKTLLDSIDNNQEKYLDEINNLANGYKINRVYNVDKCALILGMAELDTFKETDTPIIIDETVNLVAKFSAENSTDFVNGIIAEYAKGR
jgi:transcription termination factor NusB